MAGWLLGWLGVWPVGWLAGWPIGSQTGLLADWLGWRLIISSMPFLFQCSISARSKICVPCVFLHVFDNA